MIEFRILTKEEQAQAEVQWERQAAEEAEHARLVEECRQARNHEWVLELPEPAEVDNSVELNCLHCPAGINDVYPDGHDLIYLEHGDVKVEAGCHNSPKPLTIPIAVVGVVDTSMWTDCGWEYDAELVIEPRETGTDNND